MPKTLPLPVNCEYIQANGVRSDGFLFKLDLLTHLLELDVGVAFWSRLTTARIALGLGGEAGVNKLRKEGFLLMPIVAPQTLVPIVDVVPAPALLPTFMDDRGARLRTRRFPLFEIKRA